MGSHLVTVLPKLCGFGYFDLETLVEPHTSGLLLFHIVNPYFRHVICLWVQVFLLYFNEKSIL